MKHLTLYILAVTVLLLAACAGDEVDSTSQTTTLHIPISVGEAPTTPLTDVGTRATGDPGVREDLPAPTVLYLWIVGGGKVLHYEKQNELPAASWARQADDPERWDYTHTATLDPQVILADGATIQVYAIAAQHELSDTEFGNLAAEQDLNALTLNLKEWQNANAAGHSWALGNLYSTPLALMGSGNADATAAGIVAPSDNLRNGTYTVRKAGNTYSLVEDKPTRLYHCAAKADFKWEVVATQRPMVNIKSITVTDLPTQLCVFQPTHNPEADDSHSYSCPVLAGSGAVNALTPDNKWIGREYAYILQPPTTSSADDGKISYTVTFNGRTAPKSNTIYVTSSPSKNPVFTTWYRSNADIQ